MDETSTNGEEAPEEAPEISANAAFEQGLRLGIRSELGESGFKDRDRYEAFGWEVDPSEEEYVGLYLRNPFGGGLIDKAAQLAWRHNPEIEDDGESEDDQNADEDDQTDFEAEVANLAQTLNFWAYCTRVHKAAGFGEYALLFIDFDDVDDLDNLDQPVEYEDGASLDNIRRFRVIPQFAVDDREYGDFGKERWGQPEEYTIDWSEEISDDTEAGEDAASNVHYSRVVEVPSKPPLSREYQSRPRMERYLNTLYDIEKLLGSTAEMSFRGADKGLHVNFDPEHVDTSALDNTEMTKDIRQWYHGLEPTLETVGGEITDLGGDIQDPSGALDSELTALSAATGFSQQFIEGAAAGEIASSETNLREDLGEIRERQQQYVEPYIVRRGLRTLMEAGVLSRPEAGTFSVFWPDLFELSEEEQATVEEKRSQVAKNLGVMGQPAQKYVETGRFPDNEQPTLDALDESAEAVANQFDQLSQRSDPPALDEPSATTSNATRYSEGDPVQTPQGLGLVVEVRTEDFEGKGGETIEASEASPTYVVGLKDERVGVGFYSASQLDATELPETDVEDPVADAREQSANVGDQSVLDQIANALTTNDWTMPPSWRKADTPARIILLDAWSSMGGTFRGARKELGSKRLAAAMKDEVLGGWEGWRRGG